MSVVGLKTCPITGGLPTKMIRASFRALCRKKQNKSVANIHGPIPENPYCRECQGHRHPPELQFVTLAAIKKEHQPQKERPMPEPSACEPTPTQLNPARAMVLLSPQGNQFTLEHLSDCWATPALAGNRPGVCPACRQPGKRRAARGVCSACYAILRPLIGPELLTALHNLVPGQNADGPTTPTTTVSPSPEPPLLPASPPAPTPNRSGAGEFSSPADPANLSVLTGYEPLAAVLQEALDQAQRGKGAERHANAQPFLDQPILTEARLIGPGGLIFQARKKVLEAATGFTIRPHQALADLLGAINYTAALVLYYREQHAASPPRVSGPGEAAER